MINKEKLKRRFSRHAKTYDQYAVVQKFMGDHLINQVKHLKVTRILEVGSGTGYVTQKLIKTFPKAEITAVDIAEGMIKVAKARVNNDQVNFLCGDIEDLQFEGAYDLIISNATFQWFNHLEGTLSKLNALLSSKGVVCFSTFGEKTFHELHETYKAIQPDNSLRPGQSFLTLGDLESVMFNTFNQRQITTETADYTETFDSCLSFFESIKKIGANNSSSQGTVKDPTFLQNVINHYESNYTVKGKVKATYQAVFALIQ